MKKTKNIDLTLDAMKALSIEAIETGNRNLKNHIEKILEERAKKLLINKEDEDLNN